MNEIPETIFDQIAKLLPPDLREHFFRRIAHLRDLSPNDDMLLIAEAMGFLALLIRETPPLITAERQALENLHRNIIRSNIQLEERLLDLPPEIRAAIDADTIAAKIAESIRQSLIQAELASVVQELHLHVGTITEATRQLAAMAAGLDDPHFGLVARVQNAVTAMIANLGNAAAHIRAVSKDLTSQIRHAVAILCTAALTLGFLLGWFFHP
jgi:hypothetical protein